VASAATLSLDWSISRNQGTNKQPNSSTYDAVSDEVLAANYGTDLSIERYSGADGSFLGSVPLTPAEGQPELQALSGFAIGAASNGAIYLGDTSPFFPLWKTDSHTSPTIKNVAQPGQPFAFARNLSIVGAGSNTYIGGIGATDNGPAEIWKSDDDQNTTFSLWKTIPNAGKSGIGISPVEDGNPPEFVAAANVVSNPSLLRLYKYNPDIDNYEFKNEITLYSLDADFDLTDPDTTTPLIAVLYTTSSTGGTGRVALYNLNKTTGNLSLQTQLILSDLPNIGNRGSLDIDTLNKKIYVSWRSATSDTTIAIARLSYDKDPLGTPTPTPTPTPTATHTPIPTVTPTPVPENTAPIVQVMTPEGEVSGLVGINYIVKDAQSDRVNLEVWFSVDGGANYVPATMGIGGDGQYNLESMPGGIFHTFVWNSQADILNQAENFVRFKIKAFDGDLYSEESETDIFSVNNRTPLPEVRGTVKDIRTGNALGDVLVELFGDVSGALVDSDSTSTSGIYTVAAPDNTTSLRIKFSKAGYESKQIRGFTAPMLMNIRLEPTTPMPPTGLTALSGAAQTLVRWNPNTESDLAGYNVYRHTSLSGDFTKINASLITETSYKDTSTASGVEYYYKVTAVDRDGNESAPAGPVRALSGMVVVSLPDVSSKQGTWARIPINVDNAAGINPWGIDIDFRYNPANVDAVTTGIRIERTAVTSQVSFLANTTEPGKIRISSIGQADTLRGEGHLFDIYLYLKPDAAQGECGLLNLGEVKFYDTVPARLPVDYSDTGLLCISIECMQGDLNGDQVVDSADVILALKIAVGLITPTDCQMQSGDINGDGVIDSADALMIQRLSVGLPINPPQERKGKGDKEEKDWTLRTVLSSRQPIFIQIGEGQTSPGGYVFLPVEVNDATGLSGFDVTIGYPSDRSTLVLDSINVGSITGGFQKTVSYGSGYAKVSMSTQNAITGGSGSLVILKFRVSYSAPAPSDIAITLNEVKLKGQYGDSFDWYSEIEKTDGAIHVLPKILTRQDFTDFLTGKTGALDGDINGDGKVDVADLVWLIMME